MEELIEIIKELSNDVKTMEEKLNKIEEEIEKESI